MSESHPSNQSFETLLNFLKTSRGFDFTGYKRSSLMRRIDRRMQTVNASSYSDYIDYLNVHPEEFTELFNMILINVTGFFRDPAVWEYASATILPQIIANHVNEDPIRIWSAGCASGEEPYTVAMLLAELIGMSNFSSRIKIYATDLDEDALNRARAAIYAPKEVESVPPHLLEKYFDKSGGMYLLNKELRRSVIFGRHNVITDAPISRIDLLMCRNLLMYFNTDTQILALSRLQFAMRENGFLMLGKAEMLLSYSSLFTAVDLRARVFRPTARPSYRDRLQLIAANPGEERTERIAIQFQLQEVAFMANPIPQIVVDQAGTLALANECAQRQFNLAPTDSGRPFQDLQISYRPVELRALIEKCYEERKTITLSHVIWKPAAGEQHYMDILVSPLRNNGNGMIAVLISFVDITAQVHLMEKLETANRDLETTMAELQSANEELETTNEELQSTIEELETTNEELQSSNEEMETMNEELQSTNEELETITEEAHTRTEELLMANQLLDGIIRSLKSGLIAADKDARILKWNQKSEELWGMRAEEMLQKSFYDLDIGLPVMMIRPAIRQVLIGESDRVELSVPAINRRGRAINCQVVVMPLVPVDSEVSGFLLLLDDEPA